MGRASQVRRACGSCRRTAACGGTTGKVCGACLRALFRQQQLADPGRRDELARWVWDAGLMQRALARLDIAAVLVIFRSAARMSRRELAERAGVSESTLWYWEADERHGIYDIRQLLRLTDSVAAPRPALVPVILGQPGAAAERTG